MLAGLLGLGPFRSLYVADLDALLGGPPQLAALDALRRAAPQLRLWIDAGIRARPDLAPIAERGTVVLASETLSAPAGDTLLQDRDHAILSLDFREQQFLGAPDLARQPWRWPARVIAMNLARVGSRLGPDLARIAALKQLAPDARIYAAGGVRSAADLDACRRAGASGALVASSLHDGRLGRAELAAAL